jgi:hypothetical protein
MAWDKVLAGHMVEVPDQQLPQEVGVDGAVHVVGSVETQTVSPL